MSYNWKCCSFYPNNFDASALQPRYAHIPTETRRPVSPNNLSSSIKKGTALFKAVPFFVLSKACSTKPSLNQAVAKPLLNHAFA